MRRLSTFLFLVPLLMATAMPAVAQSPTTTEAPTTSVRTDILPGLLAGSAVNVGAQDEAFDPTIPTTFEWHLVGLWDDLSSSGMFIEADDPRASGTMTMTTTVAGSAADDDAVDHASGTDRLVNDGGAWTGTRRGFDDVPDIGTVWGGVTELWLMTGEAGYDGLTLILVSGATAEGPRNWGTIYAADGDLWLAGPPDAG